MPRDTAAHRVHQRWRSIAGLGAIALAAALGVLIAVRGNLAVDESWMGEIVERRSPWWEVPSFVMNTLGGGLVATIIAAALCVLMLALRRKWTALYIAVASLVSTVVVHLLKWVLGRERPAEIMLSIESGSFPSGHVANAATLATLLAIIVWRWWIVAAGAVYVVLMALSRTYLGAHWLSDTVGGLLLGAGVALVLWVPFAERLLSESPNKS
jgi:membrane-associated phospholipid phosphatase